jgi:hypothetical protein
MHQDPITLGIESAHHLNERHRIAVLANPTLTGLPVVMVWQTSWEARRRWTTKMHLKIVVLVRL